MVSAGLFQGDLKDNFAKFNAICLILFICPCGHLWRPKGRLSLDEGKSEQAKKLFVPSFFSPVPTLPHPTIRPWLSENDNQKNK